MPDRRSRLQENTLPPDERFFVIETDEGYAIWDDLTEAIYIDDEGVSEEFKSEWQANDYLEQVKKVCFRKGSCRMALCGTGKAEHIC